MADLKTLRLATLQLTEALLMGFLTYQRVLLAELAQSAPHADWAGRYAFAHGRALAESGLETVTQQQLKAIAADFCGRRSAWLTVTQRVAEAEHHVAHKTATPKDAAIVERAKSELPRLEDLSELEARYGHEAIALLKAHELELVSLHQSLVRIEGSGGHLHQPAGHPAN